jgi:uncharacterized membrane protein YbhN (UPF0104 family)
MLLQIRVSVIVRIFVGFSLGILFIWWLLRDIDIRQFAEHLIDFSWELVFPVFILVITSAVIRAIRWRLLFHDGPPSVGRLFFVENTGIGINSFAPVRVLAEPVQFSYLAIRDGHDRGSVLASIVLSRVADLVVTLSIIALGFSVFPPTGPQRAAVWGIIGALALAAGVVVVISLSTHRWGWLSKRPLVATYGMAWRRLAAQPRRVVQVLVLTVVQWTLLGIAALLIAREVGINLHFPVILVLTLATMTLGMTLPGLPSGIGPFEFAATLLLSLYGVTREPALAFGVIVHATFLLPPILIAVVMLLTSGLPWPGNHSKSGPLVASTTRPRAASRNGIAAGERARSLRE